MTNLLYSIGSEKKAFYWLAFHVTLGVLATVSTLPVIIWFYIFLISSLINALSLKKQSLNLVLAEILIYSGAFELIARMSYASPFIPYELSKYLMMGTCAAGIVTSGVSLKRGNAGLLILLFLLPSFLIDESGFVTWDDIRFNIFGIINIGLGILFFSSIKILPKQLFTWLRLMAFPVITVLVFTFIKTPDLDKVDFALGANFATAGGFGSNQVATVLGLGAFIMASALIFRFPISGRRSIDMILLAGFTFQGLLTFSRGGMIGGAIGIIILLYFASKINKKERLKIRHRDPRTYILPTAVAILLLGFFANLITDGQLALRYKGETAGTLAGTKELNLSTLTTGRFDIFMADMELWSEYPALGVGAAASKYMRSYQQGVVSHVELSRLFAEHGLFAIFIILALVSVFFKRLRTAPDKMSKAFVFAFFTIAVFTSFHAATRTFLTPLLIAMGSTYIIDEKWLTRRLNENSVHRQSISALR